MRCYIKAIVPPGLKKKLYRKWEGPFRVMKELGKNKLEIEEIEKGKRRIVHTDSVKVVPERSLPRRNRRRNLKSREEEAINSRYRPTPIVGIKTNYGRSTHRSATEEEEDPTPPPLPPKTRPRKVYVPSKEYPLRSRTRST